VFIRLLHTLKSKIPAAWLLPYHYVLARGSALVYGNPSNSLVVIGVTGTKGKSSTVQMMAQLLTATGRTVGYTGTAGFSVAGQAIENRMKMTMPGRFLLQKLLRQMVKAGCEYAIIETSSQGLLQYRHLGINYDAVVFTNLSPEHIEAHGGFAAYRAAKKILFKHLTARAHKMINGQRVKKVIVVNADDEAAEYFADAAADEKFSFSWYGQASAMRIVPQNVIRDEHGLRMTIDHVKFVLLLVAEFEQQNALCAIATLAAVGIPLTQLALAAKQLQSIPGRFERIVCGQPFTVIVDYAYEPKAIEMLLRSIEPLKPQRIIGVHGSAGGGRDVARREKIGRLAGEKEDIVIVTNEDPYDDNPAEIAAMVAAGARAVGKIDGQDLLVIMDRQAAINEAIKQAQPGDVVLVTGKGSEPVMAVAGGVKLPWDDRSAARQALAKIGYKV
jgi:UDP-N-acetylmuramoyl-L-alanyl-D-glutamate--2,6-diaminopimelate ligase